ncbi:hypothetical protein D3C78_611150 [compost metagenome]
MASDVCITERLNYRKELLYSMDVMKQEKARRYSLFAPCCLEFQVVVTLRRGMNLCKADYMGEY